MSVSARSSSTDSAELASSAPAFFPHPVFLMVNSLERGGSERQFVELAGSLKRAGTPVQLGCIQRIGPFIDELARSGFEDLREFGLGNSLYGLESLRCRWRLMRHLLKSEIAVAHSFDFYINLTLIPSAKLARVPVIGSQRQLGDLLTPAQNRAQLEMFRWCERVVCNSQAAADRLARAGLKTEKLAVIGNGLPSAAFEPAVPSIERQKGILRVGMIARMNIRAKNQSILLRAAAGLKRKFPEVEYLLVGDGPLRADLEKEAAELGVRSQVSFLGDRSDVRQILASLDVSVVPSASESLSNVMLESMAAGIPVVATSVGGNIELGSDGRAVLVPLNDEAALASGLEAVLSDGKLRDELACRARQFAERKFSLGRICQQYCELYYDVLSA